MDRTIKSIHYQLTTTIADNDNIHQNLLPGFPQMIECVEGALIYCKVQCDDQYGPLKIVVKPRSNADLCAYLSLTNKRPGPNQHMRKIKNPKKISVGTTARDKKFHQEYIYISFISHVGAAIDISCTFSTAEQALGSKALKKLESEQEEGKDALLGIQFDEEVPSTEIIDENIKQMWKWTSATKAEKTRSLNEMNERRQTLCLEKKKRLEVEKIKKSIFFMNRWDIIREKRQQNEDKASQFKRKQAIVKRWMINQNQYQGLSKIWDFFSQRKEAVKRHKLMVRSATLIKEKFKEKVVQNRETLEDRLAVQSRHALSVTQPFLEDAFRKRSLEVLRGFIPDFLDLNHMKSCFETYYESVTMLQ